MGFVLANEEVGLSSFFSASGPSPTRGSVKPRAAGKRGDTKIAKDYPTVGASTGIGPATSLT